ncbi:MAG: putative signal transduction histidine kinase [Solirubrobacterales bacterium]|nr:putative signal transduction histidine kinase [Solirubrobacterales bacterium]
MTAEVRLQGDALDFLITLLSGSEAELEAPAPSSDFYNTLCEAICRIAPMDRAALFLYDDVAHRVRAVGVYGMDRSELPPDGPTLDQAPLAQRALAEDKVLVSTGSLERELPEAPVRQLGLRMVACIPLAAGERKLGVVLADRHGQAIDLGPEQSDLLWSLGKTAALAAVARIATRRQADARMLAERLAFAAELHESVVQRLFGLAAKLRSDRPLSAEDRNRCADEAERALEELRASIQRVPGIEEQPVPSLREELERLGLQEEPPVRVAWEEGSEVPENGDALARAVVLEAVRNSRKHGTPHELVITLRHEPGLFQLAVVNDGAGVGQSAGAPGLGLRLLAFQALSLGGIVEAGPLERDRWRVRLTLPAEG